MKICWILGDFFLVLGSTTNIISLQSYRSSIVSDGFESHWTATEWLPANRWGIYGSAESWTNDPNVSNAATADLQLRRRESISDAAAAAATISWADELPGAASAAYGSSSGTDSASKDSDA